MSFWPRTLLWRTVFLIAFLLLASSLAWWQIATSVEQEPRTLQLAQTVSSVVNITRASLVNADAARRRLLLAELSEREGIRVYPAEDEDELTPPPDDARNRLLLAEIRHLLGPATRVGVALYGIEGYWVSFQLAAEDEYWVMIPPERLEYVHARQWLGWGLLALGLALFGGWAVVFRLSRPLDALARAAREIGRGKTPPPLDVSGPVEVQTVASAFNQMSRDLEQLNNDRALVLAGISHDLRTPLARMRLGVEMGVDDAGLREGLVADIEGMDAVIGQFLDFARESGGEPEAEYSADTLAEQVGDHYARIGKPLELTLGAPALRLMRPMAMKRAVMNLVDNALRYAADSAEDGQPLIVLATSQSRDALHIEVRDRGPGIAPEDVDRLKQPFTRKDASRSGARGSGLGLAIVERVARSHGGTLELLPRGGGGLVARLTLPLRQPTQAASSCLRPITS